MGDIEELASLLARTADRGSMFRVGVVSAVNAVAKTATVTVGGSSIPNVPYHLDVAVAIGSRVHLLWDDMTPYIFGRIA